VKRRLRRLLLRYPLYLLAFLLVGSAAAYISFRLLSAGLTVEVPALTGMSLAEAESALGLKGISLLVEAEEYDPTVPAGHVLGQDLEAGSHVRGEVEVKVVLSKGPEVRLIPSVIGESIGNATKLFVEKRLNLSRTIKVHSDTVVEGEIIAQRPAPEEWTGESITLIVSAGPYDVTYYCPSFQGMLKEDVLTLAAELGINVELTEPPGVRPALQIAVEQTPLPGAEIAIGGTVYIKLGGSND
jgi:serine/threonine-protein kinase